MASSRLWTAPCSSGSQLPWDAMFEVLLRLPAKELCRLRVVCRLWCALTMDPHFIKFHVSRHTDTLLAVGFWDKSNCRDDIIHGISIMDLSGNVLKRIPITNNSITVLSTCHDLVCIPSVSDRGIWVLNPATEDFALVPSWQYNCVAETYAFGQVASTGQYKLLRIVHLEHFNFNDPGTHLCEVVTLKAGKHGSWRRKPHAPVVVSPGYLMRRGGPMKSVVLNGVVYFMMDAATMEPAGIVPFNLETEEWRPILPGIEPLRSLVGDERPYMGYFQLNCDLKLANLNSCLVTVHYFRRISIDLWFLMDFERGIWVKNYSVNVQHEDPLTFDVAYPLLILDDGRIVFYKHGSNLLQSYDPNTDTYSKVEIRNGISSGIGIYTGSLLSVGSGSIS
ncbi:hypothetical protein ACP70R_000004 [Stipagrostis hirtigluma subsp. patula]